MTSDPAMPTTDPTATPTPATGPVETTAAPARRPSAARFQVGNLPAIVKLAVNLHRRGQSAKAAELYEGVLEADPARLDVAHILGVARIETGDAAGAVAPLEAAVAALPDVPAHQTHLGEAYRLTQRLDEAIACFERALELDPDDGDARCNLAHVRLQRGETEEAIALYRRTIELLPNDAEAHSCLGAALTSDEQYDEARQCFIRSLELDPENVEARHLLAAIDGDDSVATVPRRYIVELYDKYADHFDTHLAGTLRYDVPATTRAMLDAERDGDFARALDLGCGTGMSGAAVRDCCRSLVGVDLSPRMLDRARERGVYDELIEGDLIDGFARTRGACDLVLACDVLIYVGVLDEFFAGAARSLVPGGLLAFSVESSRERDVALRPSGRFAHADRYVREGAAAHGFDVRRAEPITVRFERDEPVPGKIFVCAKR